jgi:hypothetical protein
MSTSTVGEVLAQALADLAGQFKILAATERDFRAASYFLALETLRVSWEGGLFAGEPIATGDRR